MVEKLKLKTRDRAIWGYTNTKRPNLDFDFNNKYIKARGVYDIKYTKKFLKYFLSGIKENTKNVEISLLTNRDWNANMLILKDLDNQNVFVLSGLVQKDNPNLKGKKGIGNKKY